MELEKYISNEHTVFIINFFGELDCDKGIGIKFEDLRKILIKYANIIEIVLFCPITYFEETLKIDNILYMIGNSKIPNGSIITIYDMKTNVAKNWIQNLKVFNGLLIDNQYDLPTASDWFKIVWKKTSKVQESAVLNTPLYKSRS